MRRRILAVAGVIALTLPASAAFAATPADDPSVRFEQSDSTGRIDTSFVSSATGPDGRVNVIVQLSGDPVAVVEAQAGRDLSKSERAQVRNDLKKSQDSIRGQLTSKGGKIQAQMQSAYNGFQLSLPADEVDAVAALPGVTGVFPTRTYELDNAVSVPYLGVPQVWEDTGYTGENIKVAILDTGIDYTHSNFGGPGTVESYEAAAATSTEAPDPALVGPNAPRIKGGIDLVGDAYDAGGEGAALTPVPDSNPLDCQGHGTHVAGSAAGSGVNPDGTTYSGPYDSSTASADFKIGPGVAPEADLYGVRVFGCEGSTDVVVPAIDWAVANDMDVINMSLGSSWGRGDDPDAVAASNAVGAGVVVVASAGNSGPSPYLTGSPGTGDGVIAVSAVDSTEAFPGALVTVDGQEVEAINANGADLSEVGELEVVRLVDDPATTENDALGCSVEAYTRAGVTDGGGQIAVSTRGNCARVAKAIYAEQAGAEAALMVNSTDDLPPFEGDIVENPDTGDAFTVTIPFLGVRSSDGSLFVDGATVTLESQEITNPGFTRYASFTSSGPRSGDSAISPDVAAPGVSIVSAGVGTGSGAAVNSGTSMAAPHVAGVAALAAEAHPDWTAPQVTAAIVSTADPDKVGDQGLVRGGVGLVDTKQAVATELVATGDTFRTDSGRAQETALSFGFQESTAKVGGNKTVTVTNDSTKAVTYTITTAPSEQSLNASVSTNVRSITVRPGRTAKFTVTVAANARDIPTSLGEDQFSFYEISGDVVLTSTDSTLRVPYLLVPRSNSDVSVANSAALFAKGQKVTNATKSVTLRNQRGAIPAGADVYTWGLSDPKDIGKGVVDNGYDIRAAGVQSFDTSTGGLLVFAINTHQRWSSAAGNEYDVVIDTDSDGEPDWIVLSYDSGLVRAGDANGIPEVFLVEVASGDIFASGYLTQAPTDSSTLLLPVNPTDLGIDGAFDYTVQTYGLSGGQDFVDGWATYNPDEPAISNGQFVTVPQRGDVSFDVEVDAGEIAEQQPLGSLVVVTDNKSGADEALLIKLK